MKLRAIRWKAEYHEAYNPTAKKTDRSATEEEWLEAQRLVQKLGRVRLVQEHPFSFRWVVKPWG
jgi:hypothetical protein